MKLQIGRRVVRRGKPVVASLLGLVFAASAVPALAALHAGDKVSVVVYNHPELSTSPTVDAKGGISLPLAGTVVAQGRSTGELAKAIQQRLSAYVRDVAVSVQLDTQSQSIFVSGGPGGTLKYLPGETLTSVIDELQLPLQNRALTTPVNPHDAAPKPVQNGALDLEDGPVDFHHVRVLRDRQTLGPFDLVSLRSSRSTGPALEPNDTIALTDKPVGVRVVGEVLQPGNAHLDPSDNLSRALDQVGGTLGSASLVDIKLQRAGTERTLTLSDAAFSEPAQNGDKLVVPRAPTVDVLGIVEKPGATLLRGNQTLVSAVYYAGGPAKYANLKAVSVTHNGVRKQYDLSRISKGATGENPRLYDGDVVLVPQGSTFDVGSIFQAISVFGLRFGR
ncbi:MAG: hypothetical protein NVSMB5_09810 [Candidatus Velthaea sp.]